MEESRKTKHENPCSAELVLKHKRKGLKRLLEQQLPNNEPRRQQSFLFLMLQEKLGTQWPARSLKMTSQDQIFSSVTSLTNTTLV